MITQAFCYTYKSDRVKQKGKKLYFLVDGRSTENCRNKVFSNLHGSFSRTIEADPREDELEGISLGDLSGEQYDRIY